MTLGRTLLVAAGFVVFLCCAAVFEGYQVLVKPARQYQKATGTNLSGEWIGVLQARERGPSPPVHMKAAVRLNLVLNDGYLNWYTGTGGSMYFADTGKLRAVRFESFKPDTHDNSFSAALLGGSDAELKAREDEYHAALAAGQQPFGDDPENFYGGHSVEGTVSGDTMQITEIRWPDYSYTGTLHHGDDQQFAALCESLKKKP